MSLVPDQTTALLAEMVAECRRQGASVLKIEPDLPDTPANRALLQSYGFRPSEQTVQPPSTVVLDLNGTEAAALAKACGARIVVPHHYDMFAFNTATTDEFSSACDRLSQNYQVLRGGERLTIPIQTRP